MTHNYDSQKQKFAHYSTGRERYIAECESSKSWDTAVLLVPHMSSLTWCTQEPRRRQLCWQTAPSMVQMAQIQAPVRKAQNKEHASCSQKTEPFPSALARSSAR